MFDRFGAPKGLTALACACAALFSSTAAQAGQEGLLREWATLNGNAHHTGHIALKTPSPGAFTVAWTAQLPTSSDFGWNIPVTGAGRVFVSDNVWFQTGHLYALDLATGAMQWSHEFTSPTYGGIPIMNAPAYKNGMAYVSTGGHEDAALWGFDAATGQQKIRSPISAQWETYYSPTPAGDELYMNGGYYGGAYAFHSRTGAQAWSNFGLSQYDHWTPAVDEHYVYAYTTRLDVLDRKSGATVFSIADPGFDWWGYSVGCAPVLGTQRDLIVTQAHRLVSFDLDKRAVKWSVPIDGGYYEMTQPSVVDGRVFIAEGSQVKVFDEATGQLIGTKALNGMVESTVVLTNDVGFVSTTSGTVAFDVHQPQRVVWRNAAHGKLVVSRDGTLLILGSTGLLTAVHLLPH